MASDAMLPCPFCGEVPTLIEADENQGLKWGRVRCCIEGPEVRTGYDTSDDAPWHADAIAAWNRRTPAAEVAGSSDSSMPVVAWMSPNWRFYTSRSGALRNCEQVVSPLVLQSDALKAIEEALEKAAVIAERSTAKRRFAKAGVNSQTMEPCGIAQAIRSLKESL